MHTDLDQKERDLVMREFRFGPSQMLISTDLVARGIDVQQVPLDISYDPPHNYGELPAPHRAQRPLRPGGDLLLFGLAGHER